MSIEDRIHLDINYANKHNFAYDLWILANTRPHSCKRGNCLTFRAISVLLFVSTYCDVARVITRRWIIYVNR
jgi:lipopolysaccharide/colanic/teichoic acid biosynthesis glycosyltransferase